MVYVKQEWENLPAETTPISAERLAHMETQYDEAMAEQSAALELKADRSEVQMAVSDLSEATSTQFPPAVGSLYLRGYYEDGDFGAATYRRSPSEPAHAGKFQSQDGSWWEIAEPTLRPQMFGAFPLSVDVTDIAVAQSADITDAWNEMSDAANILQRNVEITGGRWAHSGTLRWWDGITYRGEVAGDTWRTVNTSNASSWPNEKFADLTGAVFVAIGTFSRDYTLRGITASPQLGFGRNVYLVDRPFNNGLDSRMDLLDLTNKDASGTTQATPRPFSVAHWFEGDNQRRHRIEDVTFIPNCPLPGETFGLGGYGLKDTIPEWADVDFGIYAPSPFGGYFGGVKALGYWNDRGLLLTGHKHSNSNIGYTENNVFERCAFQAGVSIRMCDSYPIKAKTANTVTIRWTPSWSLNSASFLFIGTSVWSYTPLQYTSVSYSPANGGELTFTVVGSTDFITIGSHHAQTGFGAGFPLTKFKDTEFFDWSHASGIPDMSPELGSRARPWSASIEIAGGTISNLRFENCAVRTHGPMPFLLGGPENIVVENGWAEGRGSRRLTTSDPVGSSPNGSVLISGPTPALLTEVGSQGTGSIMFIGPQNLHAHVNMQPLYKSPSQYAFTVMEDSITGYVRDEYKMYGQRDTSGWRLWGLKGQDIDIRSRKTDNITRRGLGVYGTGATGVGESAVDNHSIWIPDRTAADTDMRFNRTMKPGTDNVLAIGTASNRITQLFAASGTINTSDERDKTDIREVSEKERAVAQSLKRLVRVFRFRDAVAEKGDEARMHFGMIAQDVIEAFEAEGLDAMRYGIVCFDEWEAEDEVVDEDGIVIRPAVEAGNRYGIRYEQLSMFFNTVE